MFNVPLRSAREDSPRGSIGPMQMPPLVFEPAEPVRWAYKVVRVDPREEEPLDEERLAALGAEGWLLAGLLEQHTGRLALLYYFVRSA